jgi:signal transduction histidine kinase
LQARLEAVESRAGLETAFHLDGAANLDPQVEAALYRIAQEALNNVLKHAQARRVAVSLCQDGQGVMLKIVDDGVGYEPAGPGHSGGLGLRGMEERAAEIGARLEIESTACSGTTVRVTLEGEPR